METSLAPPGTVRARASFEWALGGQFILQRTAIEIPEAPDGLCVIAANSADFTPVAFAQRFIGTLSGDGATIQGRWETMPPGGSTWEHDFDLTYAKLGPGTP